MGQTVSLRIGDVAERSGLAVPTLRSWERRYGVLAPERTPGGHRLYSDDDVARVQAMQRLISAGIPTRQAAARILAGEVPPDASAFAAVATRRLWEAATTFDTPAATAVLHDVFERLDIAVACDDVLVPVMRQLGATWREGPHAIAREHFATQLVRLRLADELRPADPSIDPRVLACCPQGEHHDLGVMMASATLAGEGQAVRFIGVHTPAHVLDAAVKRTRPRVVLIGSELRRPAARLLETLRVAPGVVCVLGGDGFRDGDAGDRPGVVVHRGPYRSLGPTVAEALALLEA